ncbi:MAG: DUF1648 domain-containing protein [Bryobacteraceae bacterium]
MARPRVSVPVTPLRRGVEALAAGVLVALLVYVWTMWPQIPERVPTHFNVHGRPDRWGSGRSLLLLMPALALANFVGFTVLTRLPHLYNYPFRISEENAPRMYAIGVSFMAWMNLEIVLLFALLSWRQMEVAVGRAAALGAWLLPGVLAANAATLGIHLWRMRQAAR